MIARSEELLPGTWALTVRSFQDTRGEFVKTYHAGLFRELGIPFTPAEEFFSVSRRNVIRGMHFQLPPHEHAKLVYCINGCVTDVVVDLRAASRPGQVAATELSRANRKLLFIPPGIAHGFVAREDDTAMVYLTSAVHAPTHDAGIHWNSFDFEWGVPNPIVSERDQALPALGTLQSLF
ncbi:MAG TPA: dTDP-4-dehydrorhamnose 3,5-epimerase family protein [Bryobacteraceae bacterium]|nr:dTDP-4-dehydrorhamnose 3,5-epimerase family protein [Bryobacteraceae bacterium]